MTPIETAIRDVAEYRCERVAAPGQWRVFREDGCVMLEAYPSRPIVVCTDTREVEG